MKSSDYHHSGHTVYRCIYHVVFCPKYRRKVLVDGIDVRVKELFTEISAKYGFSICEMEVMPDHVHLLIDCNPSFGIKNCVARLKIQSSHAIREEFPYMKKRLPSLWTRGTFIASVGSVSMDTVKAYIENQKGQ